MVIYLQIKYCYKITKSKIHGFETKLVYCTQFLAIVYTNKHIVRKVKIVFIIGD